MTDDWHRLAGSRYLNLESYRRDGTPARTPLWFAPDVDGTLYAYSRADAFKVRRLRRTPDCRIAACDMLGTPTGPWLDATAALLEGPQAKHGMALLDRRYWPWKQLIGLIARLRPGAGRVVIAIRRQDPPLSSSGVSSP